MSGIDFTPTPFLYVLIGLILGAAIGWAIGFFDSNNRTAKKIEAAESKVELMTKEYEMKMSQSAQQIAVGPPASQSPQDDPGLLRLKNDNGRFVLEVDKTPVTVPLSPEKKKRLIELITVIRPWLEGGQPSQTTSQPPASDPAQTAVFLSTRSLSQPLPPMSSKKPEVEKNITELSIVAQIDTVLQARLMDTPLEKKGIRLQESIKGDLEVYVGLKKFESVDDIPDETIKAAIRAAIAEWEKRYTPGL